MKKYSIFIACLLTLIMFLSSTAMAQNVINMRLSSDQPETAPGEKGFKFFADRIAAETNGQIKITLYPNAVLGDLGETIEQVQ